jgi:hypothetical protein
MRTTIAAAAIAASLIAPGTSALAQGLFNRNKQTGGTVDPNATQANQTTPADPNSKDPLPYGRDVPAPTTVDSRKPTIPLPTGPIEPYMMTRENGPFMVLAYTYRGPDAPREALALVLELRSQYHLPAYILLPKKFPGRSNIRGVPPMTAPFVTKDDVNLPELLRTLDEAAVMVGDLKTTKDAFDLMHQIKKLHPVSIDGQPEPFHWRKGQGLSRAMTTTNPFVPAEDLFPKPPDVVVMQMNGGPHSIRFCPGRYTLQVASFGGRTTFDPKNDPRFQGLMSTKTSPLATAHEDAERLAQALSKDREVQKTGYQAYVYHDRYSSRVTIGSFNNPNDPAAQKLHDRMIELSVDLAARKVSDNMIVPANALLDLAPIKSQLVGKPATSVSSNTSSSTSRQ